MLPSELELLSYESYLKQRKDEFGYICRVRHTRCGFTTETDLFYFRSIDYHDVSDWNAMLTEIGIRYCRQCIARMVGSPYSERETFYLPYWYKDILLREYTAGRECVTVQEVVMAEVAIRYLHLRITQAWISFILEDGVSIHYSRGIRAVCSQHGKFEFDPACPSKDLGPCEGRTLSRLDFHGFQQGTTPTFYH